MYFIAAFAVLMFCLCLSMALKPEQFANGIVRFSEKAYFHPFEIVSRLLVGLAFIGFADDTGLPSVVRFFGYGLVLVGIGLALTPPSRHRQFACWSANHFRTQFRLIGLVSMPLALLLLFIALGGVFNKSI
jgi:hypothetical protein